MGLMPAIIKYRDWTLQCGELCECSCPVCAVAECIRHSDGDKTVMRLLPNYFEDLFCCYNTVVVTVICFQVAKCSQCWIFTCVKA